MVTTPADPTPVAIAANPVSVLDAPARGIAGGARRRLEEHGDRLEARVAGGLRRQRRPCARPEPRCGAEASSAKVSADADPVHRAVLSEQRLTHEGRHHREPVLERAGSHPGAVPAPAPAPGNAGADAERRRCAHRGGDGQWHVGSRHKRHRAGRGRGPGSWRQPRPMPERALRRVALGPVPLGGSGSRPRGPPTRARARPG